MVEHQGTECVHLSVFQLCAYTSTNLLAAGVTALTFFPSDFAAAADIFAGNSITERAWVKKQLTFDQSFDQSIKR